MLANIQEKDHKLSRYKILKRRLESVQEMDDSLMKSIWISEIKNELNEYEHKRT